MRRATETMVADVTVPLSSAILKSGGFDSALDGAEVEVTAGQVARRETKDE